MNGVGESLVQIWEKKIALHRAGKTFQNAFVQGMVDNNLHEL